MHYKFFYSLWKETPSKLPKVAATRRNFFSSVHVIFITCFDKCCLFYVIAGRCCFSIKIYLYPVSSTAMFLQSLKQVIWKKSVFHFLPVWSSRISYLLNFLYYFKLFVLLLLHFFIINETFSQQECFFLQDFYFFQTEQTKDTEHRKTRLVFQKKASRSKQNKQMTQNTEKHRTSNLWFLSASRQPLRCAQE